MPNLDDIFILINERLRLIFYIAIESVSLLIWSAVAYYGSMEILEFQVFENDNDNVFGFINLFDQSLASRNGF